MATTATRKKVSCGQQTLIIVTWESTLQRIGWVTTTSKSPKKVFSRFIELTGARFSKANSMENTHKNRTKTHFSFNVVRINVMHVYCLTEINTLNLTTIYKVFAYVIFHDIHTLAASFRSVGFWFYSFFFHFACWFLLICSHIKCEIKYRQQRTFIKGPLCSAQNVATHTHRMLEKNNVCTLFFGGKKTPFICLKMLKEHSKHIISIGSSPHPVHGVEWVCVICFDILSAASSHPLLVHSINDHT